MSEPKVEHIADLMARLRKAEGLNQTKFGELIGYDQTFVSKVELRDRIPSEEACVSIAISLGIDAKPLIASAKASVLRSSAGKTEATQSIQDSQPHMVRLLGEVGAGPARDVEYEELVLVRVPTDDKRVTHAYVVRGDSMAGDHIIDGDTIYVRMCDDYPDGSRVVAWVSAEMGCVFKNVRHFANGVMALVGNGEGEDEWIPVSPGAGVKVYGECLRMSREVPLPGRKRHKK